MKHTIELKLPKFLDSKFDKMTDEEKKRLKTITSIVGGSILGISVIYLIGYNRGMRKAIDSRGIYIIKPGG